MHIKAVQLGRTLFVRAEVDELINKEVDKMNDLKC